MSAITSCIESQKFKQYFYPIATFHIIVGVALFALGMLFLLTKGHPLPSSFSKILVGSGVFLTATVSILTILWCFKRSHEEIFIGEISQNMDALPQVTGRIYIDNPNECNLYKDIGHKFDFIEDIRCLDGHEWQTPNTVLLKCGIQIEGETYSHEIAIPVHLLVNEGNLGRPKKDGDIVEFVTLGKYYRLVIDQKNCPQEFVQNNFEEIYFRSTGSKTKTARGVKKIKDAYRKDANDSKFAENKKIVSNLIKQKPVNTYGTERALSKLVSVEGAEWPPYNYKNGQMNIETPSLMPHSISIFEYSNYFLFYFYRNRLNTGKETAVYAVTPCYVLLPKGKGFQKFDHYEYEKAVLKAWFS